LSSHGYSKRRYSMRVIWFQKFPCLILLLSFAFPSFATVIVEGNFKAHVTEYNLTGNHSDFGSPDLGTEITGTFSYKVEESENFTGPGEQPNAYFYPSRQDWIHLGFDIGGVNFSVPPSSSDHSYSSINVQKNIPDDPSWWDLYDMFSITESYRNNLPSDPSYVLRSANVLLWVLLWGGNDDLGAIQDFSLVYPDIDASLDLESTGFYNGNFYSETLGAELTEFTIASRTVDVPEPSGLLLSSLAFLFIGCRVSQSSKPNAKIIA
jgi:hypothetical protein